MKLIGNFDPAQLQRYLFRKVNRVFVVVFNHCLGRSHSQTPGRTAKAYTIIQRRIKNLHCFLAPNRRDERKRLIQCLMNSSVHQAMSLLLNSLKVKNQSDSWQKKKKKRKYEEETEGRKWQIPPPPPPPGSKRKTNAFAREDR